MALQQITEGKTGQEAANIIYQNDQENATAASSAKTAATNAQNTADTALSNAATAQQTANEAKTAAATAQQTANEANTTANSKVDKTTIYNVSQEQNNFTFASQNEARNAVPANIRKRGLMISYTLDSSGNEYIPVRRDGESVDASNGQILLTAPPNFSYDVPIPAGVVSINTRIVITGGTLGGAFYDSTGTFISGNYYTAASGLNFGDRVSIQVPANAVLYKGTYVKDSELNGRVPFDNVRLVSDTTEAVFKTIVESYKGKDLIAANWSSSSNWERLDNESTLDFLVGERNANTSTIVTDDIKTRATEHRVIDANTGSITANENRVISIIYMQPVPLGKTLYLTAPIPTEFGTQPAIWVYKKSGQNNVPIDSLLVSENGRYTIENKYGEEVYISFYYEVTESGTIPDFNILKDIQGYYINRGANTIKRKNGDTILNNIDRLAYLVPLGSSIKNITTAILTTNTNNINIEVATGKVVNGSNRAVVMYQLKPNTEYTLKGFKNPTEWIEAGIPIFYLYAGSSAMGDNATKSFKYENSQNGVFTIKTDATNTKISFYTAYLGTTYPTFDSADSIEVLETGATDYEIQTETGETVSVTGASGGLNDVSKVRPLQIPRPRGVARLYIEGDLTGISKDNEKSVTATLITNDGPYFKLPGLFSWQGSTSATNPTYLQKNYSLTLLDENGEEVDIKVGDWVGDSKIHLKCDWMENTHHRNLFICNAVEAFNRLKPYLKQYPYRQSGLPSDFETGARCVVDGWPFEMYINGAWHGIYTWNLRYTRQNYMIAKDKPTQILMKCGSSANPWQESTIQVNDEYWDIKAPKTISTEVKATIMRLFNFLRTQNAATFKTDLKNYMDIETVLEYFLYVDIFQMIDNFIGNMSLVTYDGVIWYPGVYDCDTTLGLGFLGAALTNPTTPLSSEQKYAPSIWFPKLYSAFSDELKTKYKEMRDSGIFTVAYLANDFTKYEALLGADMFKRDLKLWPTKPANTSGLEQNAKYIIDYFGKRLNSLDTKYGYVSG